MKENSLHRIPRRQRGMTLLDMVAVVGIAAMLFGAAYAASQTWLESRRISATEDGVVALAEALYAYRMDPANAGAWPAALADLAPYAPAFSGGGKNGVGKPYAITPPSPLNGIAPVTITTDVLDAGLALAVARQFPNGGSAVGTEVRVEVPVPGHEPAREAMLSRDGVRAMTGNLDMDGNRIVNAGSLSVTGTGAAITLGGQSLSADAIRFLNTLSGLSCTGGERVSVSGRTPSCAATSTTSGTSGTSGNRGGCRGVTSCNPRGGGLVCNVSPDGSCYCYCN